MNAYDISISGLNVEWQRLEIIAQNLANMNSSAADGSTFQPLRLVSGPTQSFQSTLDQAGEHAGPMGVQVLGVEADSTRPRQVLDPDHPHADAEGFVNYPDIDHAAQMTLMIRTSRAYEANLTTITLAQQMYSRALEIGRQA